MTQPTAPPPTRPPRASGMFTFALVAAVLLGILAFGYLLFGDFFVIAIAMIAILALIGATHYFLWGRTMSRQARQDADRTKQDSEAGPADSA